MAPMHVVGGFPVRQARCEARAVYRAKPLGMKGEAQEVENQSGGHLTRLDTERFSDVELAAKGVAENVERLQSKLANVKVMADINWVGKGREEFNNLYKVVELQLKDISKEFWSIYDALCDAEVSYLEADQELATQINSGELGGVVAGSGAAGDGSR